MLVCTLRQLPDGGIAQLVERLVRNQQVRGSNPLASKAKSVEAKSTIRAHFGCTSGSVIPLPPKRAGHGGKIQQKGKHSWMH